MLMRTSLNLNEPSLEALSYILKRTEEWPPNFQWDYTYSSNCAMRLAHQLWPGKIPGTTASNGAHVMSEAFGIKTQTAIDIFYNAGKIWKLYRWNFFLPYNWVTPTRVANKIDKYLAAA